MKQNKMQNERTNQRKLVNPQKGNGTGTWHSSEWAACSYFLQETSRCWRRETWIPLRSQMDLMPFIR